MVLALSGTCAETFREGAYRRNCRGSNRLSAFGRRCRFSTDDKKKGIEGPRREGTQHEKIPPYLQDFLLRFEHLGEVAHLVVLRGTAQWKRRNSEEDDDSDEQQRDSSKRRAVVTCVSAVNFFLWTNARNSRSTYMQRRREATGTSRRREEEEEREKVAVRVSPLKPRERGTWRVSE